MSLRNLSKIITCRSIARNAAFKNDNVAPFTTSAKKTHIIVNALGLDRVGIVSDITKIVSESNGNVGESQATKLGSYFSLTMLLSVPPENSSSLKTKLKNIQGMSTNYVEAEGDPNAFVVKNAVGYSGRFVVDGVDDPGLVHKITSSLGKYNLSIDTMETSDEEAPFGGAKLFHIDGIVTAPKPLPKSFDTNKIRKELVKIGDSLNCDITLEDNVKRNSRPNWIWENVA